MTLYYAQNPLDMTQQTQRTFARTNLLRTCYGEGSWCNGFWPLLRYVRPMLFEGDCR